MKVEAAPEKVEAELGVSGANDNWHILDISDPRTIDLTDFA
jgi:predicted SAM-dependent methyltransferase